VVNFRHNNSSNRSNQEPKRDVGSEIDYSDTRSTIRNFAKARRRQNFTAQSDLNRQNLKNLEKESQRSQI
jgi:hypothetical protein